MPTEWLFGLIGGLLIGLSGVMFLLMNGRILGASGVIGGLVDGSGKANAVERIGFLAGLFLVPAILALAVGGQDTHLNPNLIIVAIGGILVGVGSRLANGCTSGHGVCGISRLSVRGMAATVVYLTAGGVAMVLFRHVMGWI